jgi:soluble lytic murein transglycosylase
MHHFRPLTCILTLALVTGVSSAALARAHHKQAERQTPHAKKSDAQGTSRHQRKVAVKSSKHTDRVAAERQRPAPTVAEKPAAPETPPLSGDLATVKTAFELIRKGKTTDATTTAKTIEDPAARKLVEWFTLRHAESAANFSRYAAFVADNPGWPSVNLMRRRAESLLWQDRGDATAIRNFIGDRPVSPKGRLALAKALLAEGDRDAATREVRAVWRSEELSERTEADMTEAFGDLLGPEDHRARMDRRIGAKDFAGARRAARRLSSDDVAIVKACVAVKEDDKKVPDLLDDVPAGLRGDLGYTLCRVQDMMRHDRIADATRVMLAASRETMAQQDTDEWWRVRRVLARKLLDLGLSQDAYQITRDAALPQNDNYRAESHFLPGWIALRYLNDPKLARAHFAHIDEGTRNPIVLARANYWRGRAAEALGDNDAMRTAYQAAARHPTAYYGQLARARLGVDRIELSTPEQTESSSGGAADERVRAADMLYSLGERDLVLCFASDLAGHTTDVSALAALGELSGRRGDARTMLQIGKAALARGLALDLYAFPTIGIPQHSPVGPAIDRSIIYSVARTESAFDQRDKSSANAVGLMQVTPEAGRDTAKRFKVSYDWDRMVSDPVYNTQMGAAELSALLSDYRGSHIMTFAGYNAGRGRVQDWVKAHGDPRDPNVDVVDWVERIPIAETRNYVQRVMENLQVYRVRFDANAMAVSEFRQTPPTATRAATSSVLTSPRASAAASE